MAPTSRSVSSRGVLRRWNASRCAPFGPMPGRRCSSAIRRTRGSGSDIDRLQRAVYKGGMVEIGIAKSEALEARQLETAHHAAHFLRHFLVGLALRVIDSGHDQVLQHVDIVLRDN